MKKKRFAEDQIIAALKEHESGAKVEDICRRIGISVGTFYNWQTFHSWAIRSLDLSASLARRATFQIKLSATTDRIYQ